MSTSGSTPWPAPTCRSGIIAAGTGNDIARALGLPVADPGASADMVTAPLLQPDHEPPDRHRCTARARWTGWFLGVLGAGFDAMVNERANGWPWPRGRLRYDLAIAARAARSCAPRRYRLVLDGEPLDARPCWSRSATARRYGGGMQDLPGRPGRTTACST